MLVRKAAERRQAFFRPAGTCGRRRGNVSGVCAAGHGRSSLRGWPKGTHVFICYHMKASVYIPGIIRGFRADSRVFLASHHNSLLDTSFDVGKTFFKRTEMETRAARQSHETP